MNIFELNSEQWGEIGLSAGILVAVAILGRVIIAILINRIVKRIIGQTKTTFDDVILATVKPSLFRLILVFALRIALSRLDFISEAAGLAFDNLYFVLYLVIGFGFAWRLVGSLSDWYSTELAPKTDSNLDEQLMPFLRRVALIILSVLAGIILLGRFNIEVSGLVATLGISSLAIALAAQAALSDIISGFLIMIDRPFRIGDRVEILDLDTWGDVIDIGLRSARIRTRDNRMVIVPNSVIAKSLLVNYSYPDSQYRIQIELGIGYGTDLEEARRIIIKAVSNVEGVLTDRKVEALFLQFGDSALIFRVRWWLESYVDTRRMFDRVNSAIYNALNEAGIEIPFPTREIYHKIAPGDSEHIGELIRKSRK
ncbi:MAG: mechanosensitive ion channel [Chloroflexi bacterium]|nr:mechanosensitive ion channel [Chloroflexota bacterium]